MHENVAEEKDVIEIDIPEAEEWIERIGKTAYELCNNNNRIRLKTEFGHGTGLILKSNDSAALSYIGYAIERHLDEIPSKLRPSFLKILDDVKARKENLERS
jgi:hypothetical protein